MSLQTTRRAVGAVGLGWGGVVGEDGPSATVE